MAAVVQWWRTEAHREQPRRAPVAMLARAEAVHAIAVLDRDGWDGGQRLCVGGVVSWRCWRHLAEGDQRRRTLSFSQSHL